MGTTDDLGAFVDDDTRRSVLRRGRDLRRRRQGMHTALVAIALQVAVAGAALVATDSEQDDTVVPTEVESAASDRVPASTVTTGAPVVLPDAPPAEGEILVPVPSPGPPSVETTSTTGAAPPPCRNSTERRCGPFSWTRDPGENRPLALDVSYMPADPEPGEEVTFTITVHDPDAPFLIEAGQRFGDKAVSGRGPVENCGRPYGPWDPPERRAFTEAQQVRWTFREAGTHPVSFVYTTAATRCADHPDPYGSVTEAKLEVVVEDAEPGQPAQ